MTNKEKILTYIQNNPACCTESIGKPVEHRHLLLVLNDMFDEVSLGGYEHLTIIDKYYYEIEEEIDVPLTIPFHTIDEKNEMWDKLVDIIDIT